MTYEMSASGFSQLHQTRDTIRLLKHSTMAAEDGTTVDAALLASYLTLMDEQLTLVVDDAVSAFPQNRSR